MSDQSGRVLTYFHGTTAALSVGDVLVSGERVGKDNWPGMGNGWGVWMTPHPDIAATYGPFIYEVEPQGDVTDWCDENGWDRTRENSEYVTDTAKVVRVVTTPARTQSDESR